MLKLSNEESKKVLFLQQLTGVAVRDFVENEEQIAIVVANGDIGKAIGRNGKNITSVENRLKKKVWFVEHSEELNRFVENIFFPIKTTAERKDDEIIISIESKNKKFIIGKGGSKIKLARQLLDRHFGIRNIRISENRGSFI
ncbi:MAG: NusA-like transcription termination signal-binding factor [Candidatus Micrarchaeia archaeon]